MNTREEIATLIAEKIYTNNAMKIPAVDVKLILDTIIDNYRHAQDSINHNDLSLLNTGDYQHLSVLEKSNMMKLCGFHDPGIEGLFPTSGAIKKGDKFIIEHGRVIQGFSVRTFDTITAIVNTPGQTFTNWLIESTAEGYTPENSAYKATNFTVVDNPNLYANIPAVVTYVGQQIANLVASAPATLDTLNEIATALGNDPNFGTTIIDLLAGKQATLVSGTNIKTINGLNILGSGNISISSGGMIALIPHDNGVPSFFTDIDLAYAAATPGDVIEVSPGTYSTFTTSPNGLAKDGIKWRFREGSFVGKITSGPMFRNNSFPLGFSVYGQGSFQCSSLATNVYLIDGARQNIDTVFECSQAITTTSYDAIATNCSVGSFNGLNITKIKANYVTSSTGCGVGFYGYGLLYDIEIGNGYTPSNVTVYGTATEVKGKIKYINLKSGSTHAVQLTSYNNRIAFEGVSAIPGGSGVSFMLAGDSYSDISYYSISSPNGMADVIASGDKVMTIYVGQGVNVNSSVLWSRATLAYGGVWNNGSLNGSAIYLILQGGVFSGEVTGLLLQNGGRFEGVIRYSGRGDYSGASISAGVAIIREFGHLYNKLSISGTADVTLHNYYTGANNDAGYNGSIDLSAGNLRIMGIVRNNNTANTGGNFPCVNWTGGTLILHSSAVFYCAASDSAAIKATGSMIGKIYGKVVSNTADTGTITWQVGTGADRVVDSNVR